MARDPRHSPVWTAEEVRKLRELAAAGTPINVIARKLGRTIQAVRHKVKRERIALAGGKGK